MRIDPDPCPIFGGDRGGGVQGQNQEGSAFAEPQTQDQGEKQASRVEE